MSCHGVEFGMHEFPSAKPFSTRVPLFCRVFGHNWSGFVPTAKQNTANIVHLYRYCCNPACDAEQKGRRA